MFDSMKKTDSIVTAANSKTMNAVEKTALFAEAEIRETTPDFTSREELPQTGHGSANQKKAESPRKKRKKNQ